MAGMARMLNYGRHLVERDDIEAVIRVLEGELITQGPIVERFEKIVAERVGARHAIAVSSGTAALHVAALAAGVNQDTFALSPALTFSATANAILYCGGDTGLIDIDAVTLSTSPDDLARRLESRPDTKVVLPVHMAGLAQDPSVVRSIVKQRIVIEDASHALGAFYPNGIPVGGSPDVDMTVFSFHPVKPITTGEGGMITTNDDELARRLRLFRNHGIERSPERLVNKAQAYGAGGRRAPWYQEQQYLGFNYRMSDIHAALGLSQLNKLDRFIARRREIASYFDSALKNIAALRPYHADKSDRARSSHHLYIVDIDFAKIGSDRIAVFNRLQQLGVGCQVHYLPIYRHPFYQKRLGDVANDFPAVETYYRGCMSIPFFQGLTDEEVEHVACSLIEVCGG
jgi:UDP-4-amino-4,6-dideoxy-N-acetyl-beta-L-altrosamine transaminase